MQHVERTRGRAQVLLREVQIDRGLFQITVPEQDLDRAQISTGFEQMRRKAVAQGVRMDMLMLQTSAERGLLARSPEHLGGYRTARRMPPVAGKQPLGRLVPKPAPVAA